ncbi:MBL fold metallo-hydrolase [Jatrophihabitans endophyticus]|uniref:MBL fold metallo-hydrolase n=1 Tax=Jatrophihabitans endophyticus TaxID=1206085 RepID=UPI0019E00802|nr:MBL fold metallo-hydrolase [Jatrophihabitans endophyticus]MBE7190751.1 MBL fold metallo-hydrolase [Jatrophihabitans endophyticus]
MAARVDHTVTSGTFSLDGGTWDVDNNVWVVGDDTECVVIDAPHHADPIAELIGDRRLLGVLCTHAHDDHVTVAAELADRFDAPIRLHPDEQPLWAMTYPDRTYEPLADGDRIPVAGITLHVLHTPGHSPGAVCFFAPEVLGAVFTGDTLFQGGPGATGRSYSDYDTIVASIRSKLLLLPGETVVHTGHGDDTTIAAEAEGAEGWTKPS